MKVHVLRALYSRSDDAEPAGKDEYNRKPAYTQSPQKRYIFILRCSVLTCIVLVAGVIGYFAYTAVFWAERNQFEHEYSDLVKQLLPATNLGILKTASAVMNAVDVIGDFYPNASAWPNVAYAGFPNMAILTSGLSGAVGLGFTPIVTPSEVASFEDFAYNHYAQFPSLYPPGTAEASFGRGMHNYNYSLVGVADFKYHDTTGDLPWASPNRFLTPYMQINGPGFVRSTQNKFLMLNLRGFEEAVTDVQDAILDCVANRVHMNQTCAMVSGMKKFSRYFTNNPHLFIMQPFIAMDNPRKVLGFVSGTIFFSVIVKDKIPVGTSGIDFVVHSGDLLFTYRIVNGVPKFLGAGDFHDHQYDKYERVQTLVEGLLTPMSGMLYTHKQATASTYTISFYPTREYVASFETNLRWIFCFGSVALIMFVSVIFITYDYFMVRENTEQQAVLDTKRQFVRFISHEVRTPLNAVAMAGDLMRDQLVEAIKRVRMGSHNNSRKSTVNSDMSLGDPTLEDSLELCEEIIGNTKNAVEVLDDLLNYDKIEVGGLSLDLTFVAMEHMLENVLKPFKGPAKQKDVSIVIHSEQYLRSAIFQNHTLFGGKFSVLRVVGDKIRLEQVIRNLISNALKFTSAKGKVVVTLEWVDSRKVVDSPPAPVQVKSFLKAPSPMSSVRRSKTSESPKSRSQHSVMSEGDVEMGKARITQIPEDSAFPSIRSVSSPTKSAGAVDASMGFQENDDFNRNNIIKSAMTRKPKDAHNSRHWGSLRLSVTDDGAGMSPEQLRAVCSEGVQFNANELQAGQGSGLGLFIAKGIVKQHGGLMTVKSEGLHKGSTFVVELPVYACDVFSPWENRLFFQAKSDLATYEKYGAYGPPVAPPSMVAHEVDDLSVCEMSEAGSISIIEIATPKKAVVMDTLRTERTKQHQERRVLVVDDVASNRKLVIRLLQRSGVQVCEQAADGLEAVNVFMAARQSKRDKAIQEYFELTGQDGRTETSVSAFQFADFQPFDAILMDCEMPVMNGPTATKKLRELGCTVPIVGISGNVLPADVQLFINHGANAVLPKPLDFAELEKIWNAADAAGKEVQEEDREDT